MRSKPTPALRAPIRPDPAPDAKDPPSVFPADSRAGVDGTSAHQPPPRHGPDLAALLSAAMSAVSFDAESLRNTLDGQRRAKTQPVDWRLAAAAAILVILIFTIDLIVQLV